jgi:hypothetical protein
MANDIFNRTFESHSTSFANFGCIDIQFDFNFEDPMYVPVADAHGLVDEDILRLVYPLFDIYIIHSFTGDENKIALKREVDEIKKIQNNPLIIIIYHDLDLLESKPILLPEYEDIPSERIIEISIKKYIGLTISDQ